MKYFIVLCSFMGSNLYSGIPLLAELRVLYQKSVSDESCCNQLLNRVQAYDEFNNATAAGYRACATMLKAKFIFNPFIKYSMFLEGRDLLERCISKDTKNVELRFLRFSIQSNAPAFLGYRNAIDVDRSFLINALTGLKDVQLKNWIVMLLKKTESLYLHRIPG